MNFLRKIEDQLIKKVIRGIGGQEHLALQMDLTNVCNLRCSHCYHSHHKNTGALNLSDWFQILDQYEEMLGQYHLKPSILLCGGEPTLSPYLFPILERLNKKWDRPPVALLTNGTRLNQTFLNLLKPYNIVLQVSLDGPDEQRHDEVRGKGSFKKALGGAQLAVKSGIPVDILAILSRRTSPWISEFFEMAKVSQFRSMNFTRFIPQGFGKNLTQTGQDDSLYGFELRDALKSIVQRSKTTGIATYTHSPLYSLIDPSLGHSGRFGFQGLIVDYKGNLKVSSRSDFDLGNVLANGLQNLFFNHPVMKDLRSGKINGCGDCLYFSRCGGDRNISYALTGSFLEKDQGCWLNLQPIRKEKSA